MTTVPQPAAPVKLPPNTYIIGPFDAVHKFVGGCPHAQSLLAYSLAHASSVLISLPCNQWSCRYCAERKTRKLAVKTRLAEPNRLLTLTVDPKLWENPRAAFDGTRGKVPDLISTLRHTFGDIQYLRVTELTAMGWPHYHLLLRSKYLPHAVVRKHWSSTTGATVVDIRQVDKSWCAYRYLIKYLSKLHKIEWTERHVSYSRTFFPPDPPDPRPGLELQEPRVYNQHPSSILFSYYADVAVQKLTESLFLLASFRTPEES